MTPGMSLPPKTTGRSSAPVASTARLGDDAPVALARLVGRRRSDVIVHALDRAEDVVVIPAEDGGARHQRDIGQAMQVRRRTPAPSRGPTSPPISSRSYEERAAQRRTLVGEDHARARARRRQRRHQPRGTGADHQQVAMRIGLLVLVGIGLLGRAAQPCRAADQRLVDLLPEALRPHEGLVVEAGDEDRRGQRIDRADVEIRARASGSGSWP